MRHRHQGRKLKRTSAHLLALKRNLACRLFAHERIETTVPKAKELRPFAERLITVAKRAAAALGQAQGDTAEAKRAKLVALNCRRKIVAVLGGKKAVIVGDNKVKIANKLINDLGTRYANRPGGYTRILKLTKRRLGDGTPLALIELLKANEPVGAAAS